MSKSLQTEVYFLLSHLGTCTREMTPTCVTPFLVSLRHQWRQCANTCMSEIRWCWNWRWKTERKLSLFRHGMNERMIADKYKRPSEFCCYILLSFFRFPAEQESLPDQFYFSDFQRPFAAIAAFHLDRWAEISPWTSRNNVCTCVFACARCCWF